MNKEIRTYETGAELRIAPDSRKVEGYGIVFGKESRDLGGFTEIILPGAAEGVIEQSDVLALLNHDIQRGVLARSNKGKGSLNMQIDTRGVSYNFIAPDTALGNELVEGIKRNDIQGSSFAFSVLPDGERWERREDDTILRTIIKFDKLFDMSPCYREAYTDTTVAVRSLDEFKKINLDGDNNPQGGDPSQGKLKEPYKLTNAELAQRARNDNHKIK